MKKNLLFEDILRTVSRYFVIIIIAVVLIICCSGIPQPLHGRGDSEENGKDNSSRKKNNND